MHAWTQTSTHTYTHTHTHTHTHINTTYTHTHTLYTILTTFVSIAPGNLRLRDGLHPYEGRLEIFLNDQWGTICDDGWSKQDADVACRQLGFSESLMAVHGSYYGAGDGEILLDEVACTGQESSLLSCNNGTIDCSHGKGAGVVCLSKQSVAMVMAL